MLVRQRLPIATVRVHARVHCLKGHRRSCNVAARHLHVLVVRIAQHHGVVALLGALRGRVSGAAGHPLTPPRRCQVGLLLCRVVLLLLLLLRRAVVADVAIGHWGGRLHWHMHLLLQSHALLLLLSSR